MSAYLLTRQLLESRLGGAELLRYFIARVARIYPLFLLVLSYEIFVGFDLQHRMSPELAWRHLTLREGVFVYWTIVAEFQYYFVIPLLVAAYRLIGPRRWPVALALVLFLLLLSLRRPGSSRLPPEIANYVWTYLPSFLFGSIAAAWVQHKPGLRLPPPLTALAFPLVWLTLPDGLTPLWQALSDRPLNAEKLFPRMHWVQGLLWTVVVLGGRHPFWQRLFENGVLRFYGRISYSLYLFHQITLAWVWFVIVPAFPPAIARWNSYVIPALYLGIPTLLAFASYRYFELPTVRLGKSIAARLTSSGPSPRQVAPS